MLFKSEDHSAPSADKPVSPPAAKQKVRSAASVINEDINITGDLVGDGDLQVLGSVEGDIKCESLTIGEHGSVKGEVEADRVTVGGALSGTVRARIVTMTQAAAVEGSLVVAESLSIEAGARFDGEIQRSQKAAAGQSSHDDTFDQVKEQLAQPIEGHGRAEDKTDIDEEKQPLKKAATG